MRCHICNEPFGPRGLPIHMAMRHGIRSQHGKGRLTDRMREAIRTGPDLLALQYPWPIEFGSREAAGWNRAFETMRAALATPPSEKATRPNLAPTRDDVEWLIWYARKVKGTVTEVAQRALDENPGLRPGGWATPPSEEATGLREALERIAALGPKGPFLMVTDELREAQDIARAALAKGSE
jgi:hypothetical protein